MSKRLFQCNWWQLSLKASLPLRRFPCQQWRIFSLREGDILQFTCFVWLILINTFLLSDFLRKLTEACMNNRRNINCIFGMSDIKACSEICFNWSLQVVNILGWFDCLVPEGNFVSSQVNNPYLSAIFCFYFLKMILLFLVVALKADNTSSIPAFFFWIRLQSFRFALRTSWRIITKLDVASCLFDCLDCL